MVRISLARGFPERLGWSWVEAAAGESIGHNMLPGEVKMEALVFRVHMESYGYIELQSITYTYTYYYLHISTYYMFLVNYNKHSVPADLPRVNKSKVAILSGAAASIC